MYEKFTDRSRKVMHFANQEAIQLKHEWLGTEHILLGLIREGPGVAVNVLRNMGVSLDRVREEVVKRCKPGPMTSLQSKLPHTPRVRLVLEYASSMAKTLNHNYVGTEHLLLGLLRAKEGIACEVLENLGVKIPGVLEEINSLLSKQKIEGMTPEIMTEILRHAKDNPLTEEFHKAADIESKTPITLKLGEGYSAMDRLDQIKSIVDIATDPAMALRAIKKLLEG
jgi:ATP-dependent Clp protease ATP-binding subunit ClpC